MLDLLPDLCDEYPELVQVLECQFQHYGKTRVFSGQAVTVKCYEDNSRIKEQLAQPGEGKVLIVDGGGSYRRALLGDLIAESAVNNNWEGVIIYGCIRDVATINRLQIGVKALGTVPVKTERKGLGDINIPIRIAAIDIQPTHWVYADENGVLISAEKLSLPH